MKKWVVLIIACLFTNILAQTNISPQFSELKGMEDQLGNTHLFYRIYEDTTWGEYYFSESNNIYKYSVSTGTDSFFLGDYAYGNENGQYFFRVNDYDFWDENEYKYIYWQLGNRYNWTKSDKNFKIYAWWLYLGYNF